MPARQVCQNFFPRCVSTVSQIPTKCFAGCHHRSHQWRITDADQHRALFTRPGSGQNKIKRVDRLLGNESLHRDIPLIFRNIIAMLTSQLSIVTDAGFQSAWCWHIRSLGWDFICRVRGNIQMQLDSKGECWFRRQELQARSKPEYLGTGTLARSEYARCDGHFFA